MNTRTTSTPTEYRDSLTSRKLLVPSNELFRLGNPSLRAKQLANHKSMQQKTQRKALLLRSNYASSQSTIQNNQLNMRISVPPCISNNSQKTHRPSLLESHNSILTQNSSEFTSTWLAVKPHHDPCPFNYNSYERQNNPAENSNRATPKKRGAQQFLCCSNHKLTPP